MTFNPIDDSPGPVYSMKLTDMIVLCESAYKCVKNNKQRV